MPLVIILFALFSSVYGISKATLDHAAPFFLIGSRMTFAGVLLLGYVGIFSRQKFSLSWQHLKLLFILALTAIYVTNISEIWGMQYMVSAKACLLYSLSPFIAALMAFFMLQETLSPGKWVGMSVGFFGLLPILVSQEMSEAAPQMEWLHLSWGDVAVLVAVVSSVYGWIVLKQLVDQHRCSPVLANAVAMTVGGGLALAHSYLGGESWDPVPVYNVTPFLENTLLLCLISNLICYNLYGYLLKRYSATFMAFAGLVTPFFASLFGWFFLGEQVTWHFFLSMTLFSVGLYIFHRDELQLRSASATSL